MKEIYKTAAAGPSRKELRVFGLTAGAALGILGGMIFFKGGDCRLPVYSGLALLLAALFIPGPLRPIRKIWMLFAITIGWIVSRATLILIYFLALAPTAFLARLFKKRFLGEGICRETASYWNTQNGSVPSKEGYLKQY